mgnify:CR=1 FL=1
MAAQREMFQAGDIPYLHVQRFRFHPEQEGPSQDDQDAPALHLAAVEVGDELAHPIWGEEHPIAGGVLEPWVLLVFLGAAPPLVDFAICLQPAKSESVYPNSILWLFWNLY